MWPSRASVNKFNKSTNKTLLYLPYENEASGWMAVLIANTATKYFTIFNSKLDTRSDICVSYYTFQRNGTGSIR